MGLATISRLVKRDVLSILVLKAQGFGQAAGVVSANREELCCVIGLCALESQHQCSEFHHLQSAEAFDDLDSHQLGALCLGVMWHGGAAISSYVKGPFLPRSWPCGSGIKQTDSLFLSGVAICTDIYILRRKGCWEQCCSAVFEVEPHLS